MRCLRRAKRRRRTLSDIAASRGAVTALERAENLTGLGGRRGRKGLKVCARWANHLSEQRLELAYIASKPQKRLGPGKEVAEKRRHAISNAQDDLRTDAKRN